MRTSLTIAGADPSGGAGLQSDIATFRAFGVNALSVATALTAQNGVRVRAVQPVSPRFLTRQITVLLEEFTVDSVKIGMLATAANALAVARLIKAGRLGNVVLDTVLRSSSGRALIDKGGVEAIRKLIPLSTVATPNLAEASALTGIRVRDVEGMEEAARALGALGARYVLVTGGHLEGAPVDVLYDGRRLTRFTGRRLAGGAGQLHGTGCLLSAAIAAGLARGRGARRSVGDARAYVEDTLRHRGAG
ncbi:MAG: bifunctional hydroxymethylpyrimidine kinase/phosphomethylpyrimidine kinase [Thermodesulfobacteriota bacterium]